MQGKQLIKMIAESTLMIHLQNLSILIKSVLLWSAGKPVVYTVRLIFSKGKWGEVVQLIPLHSPHTTEHSRPSFLEVYPQVSESILQLQRITFIRVSGAGVCLQTFKSIFRCKPSPFFCIQICAFRHPELSLVIHTGTVILSCCCSHR